MSAPGASGAAGSVGGRAGGPAGGRAGRGLAAQRAWGVRIGHAGEYRKSVLRPQITIIGRNCPAAPTARETRRSCLPRLSRARRNSTAPQSAPPPTKARRRALVGVRPACGFGAGSRGAASRQNVRRTEAACVPDRVGRASDPHHPQSGRRPRHDRRNRWLAWRSPRQPASPRPSRPDGPDHSTGTRPGPHLRQPHGASRCT